MIVMRDAVCNGRLSSPSIANQNQDTFYFRVWLINPLLEFGQESLTSPREAPVSSVESSAPSIWKVQKIQLDLWAGVSVIKSKNGKQLTDSFNDI